MTAPAFPTRAKAEAHVAALFTLRNYVTTYQARCYVAWTETWQRKDGTDVTDADVEAFRMLPRGQGHRVTAAGSVVTLNCECDSGD